MPAKAKLDGSVTFRLTPYQTRKLRALFKETREAAKAGMHGILAAQLYAPGDYVHGHGLKDIDHAVARVGFLRQELAQMLAPEASRKRKESAQGKSGDSRE